MWLLLLTSSGLLLRGSPVKTVHTCRPFYVITLVLGTMGVWGLAPISREAIKKRGCGGLPPPLREAPHYWEHPAGVALHVCVLVAPSGVTPYA